jgi:hypothetical protein
VCEKHSSAALTNALSGHEGEWLAHFCSPLKYEELNFLGGHP